MLEFKIGDKVILNIKNIRTTRLIKSLDYKNLVPFKIIRVIDNNAYELDLPEAINGVFPIFYPWLLYLNKSNPLPG